MKPGRGIVCEEHLLGPAVPLFDSFAGCMRICDCHSYFVVKLYREQFPESQWPSALSDSNLDTNTVNSQSFSDAGAEVEAAHLCFQYIYSYSNS
ncbi:MAG TPA: hypothetical protein VF026_18375 [Ktedonobacteraceae bacterium]